MQYASLA